jgi:hypothetical protein
LQRIEKRRAEVARLTQEIENTSSICKKIRRHDAESQLHSSERKLAKLQPEITSIHQQIVETIKAMPVQQQQLLPAQFAAFSPSFECEQQLAISVNPPAEHALPCDSNMNLPEPPPAYDEVNKHLIKKI